MEVHAAPTRAIVLLTAHRRIAKFVVGGSLYCKKHGQERDASLAQRAVHVCEHEGCDSVRTARAAGDGKWYCKVGWFSGVACWTVLYCMSDSGVRGVACACGNKASSVPAHQLPCCFSTCAAVFKVPHITVQQLRPPAFSNGSQRMRSHARRAQLHTPAPRCHPLHLPAQEHMATRNLVRNAAHHPERRLCSVPGCTKLSKPSTAGATCGVLKFGSSEKLLGLTPWLLCAWPPLEQLALQCTLSIRDACTLCSGCLAFTQQSQVSVLRQMPTPHSHVSCRHIICLGNSMHCAIHPQVRVCTARPT